MPRERPLKLVEAVPSAPARPAERLLRIADVAIGGSLAVVAVYLLCLELNRTGPGRRPPAHS